MPNEPVMERVCARMAATLASITGANGYFTDLKAVYRTFRAPEMALIVPYACVLAMGADIRVGEPIMHLANDARVSVYIYIEADMAADPDADTKLNRAVADVERCILSDSPLQGGAAGSNVAVILDELLCLSWRRVPFGDGPSWVNGAEIVFAPKFIHHYTDPRLGRGES